MSFESDRVSERKAYQGSILESTVSYVYDDKGRVISVTCLDAIGDEYSKTEYEYDAEGKVVKESVTYDAGTKNTIEYSYDSEGRLLSKEYPANTGLGTVSYEYDIYGKCIKVLKDNATVREYIYDGLDRISKIKDHREPGDTSAITTSYTYDIHSRVTSMETVDGNEAVLESLSYTYDKNDQILSYTHVNDLPEEGKKINETREYTYDDHGNLTKSVKTDNGESGLQSETTYTYDNVGNRLTMQVDDTLTKYEYNGLNQLVSMGRDSSLTEYDYDVRGNQISEETTVTTGEEDAEVTSTSTTSMSYAATGEMVSLTKTEGSTDTLTQSNVYDHDGIRISRTEGEVTREYYYDSGVVVYTKDGSDISSANILSPEGAAIGTYRGNDYYTYLNDIQGSTTNLVKSDGSLAAAYDYTDFGETTEITGSNFDNQVCYTGGIYDKETELYYLNARYYDPAIGRFISQDTYRGELNNPGQWHLYAYCANNPINYVDPSGHAHILALSSGMYFAINTTVSIGAVLTVSTGVVIAVAAVMGGIYLGGKLYKKVKKSKNYVYSKGGKKHIKDSGLSGYSDSEVSKLAKDKSLSSSQRKKFITEDKARKNRNQQKRNNNGKSKKKKR